MCGASEWRSDGTEAGTVPFSFFPRPGAGVEVSGVYFYPGFDTEHGWELWKSDGTKGGVWYSAATKTAYDKGTSAVLPHTVTAVGDSPIKK